MQTLGAIKVILFISVLLLWAIVSPVNMALAQTFWSTNAIAHRGQNGQRFTYVCPGSGNVATVYGTNIYTDNSSICTAAVHAGLITMLTGGPVSIEILPGQPSYTGSERNGVKSYNYGLGYGSFSIIPGTTQSPLPRPTNNPPHAPTLLNPVNTWYPPITPAFVTFQWQNHGDPDGTPVFFFIQIYRYEHAAQQWIPRHSNWVTNGTSYTLTNLELGSYYGWRVYAVDGSLWSNPAMPFYFSTLSYVPEPRQLR